MSRDYKVYLEDIIEAINKISKYTSGLSLEYLWEDSKTLEEARENLI